MIFQKTMVLSLKILALLALPEKSSTKEEMLISDSDCAEMYSFRELIINEDPFSWGSRFLGEPTYLMLMRIRLRRENQLYIRTFEDVRNNADLVVIMEICSKILRYGSFEAIEEVSTIIKEIKQTRIYIQQTYRCRFINELIYFLRDDDELFEIMDMLLRRKIIFIYDVWDSFGEIKNKTQLRQLDTLYLRLQDYSNNISVMPEPKYAVIAMAHAKFFDEEHIHDSLLPPPVEIHSYNTQWTFSGIRTHLLQIWLCSPFIATFYAQRFAEHLNWGRGDYFSEQIEFPTIIQLDEMLNNVRAGNPTIWDI